MAATTTNMMASRVKIQAKGVHLKKRMVHSKTRQVTRALSDTQVIMSLANASMLGIGRFGFLPYQRRKIQEAGLPEQNDEKYFEAGDKLAQEAAFATKDPAGFNLIDTLAWGSLGHVLGFACLAA